MTKKFICSAPWQGLFINPDGDFRVCCAGSSLGNLNYNTIDKLVNGPKLLKVQQEILTNGYSDYCKTCMDLEEVQGRSLREQFKTDLTDVDTKKFAPTVLDIRWRNTCQLRCGYCSSPLSSAYAVWEGKTFKVSPRNWQPEVIEYLRQSNADIASINLLGGEPLLLKENLELLDLINSSTHVGTITNLSVPDIDRLGVYQKLIKHRSSFFVSLESIGNKFEYIRRNARWAITKQNYENLITIQREYGMSLGCHMTYCIYSAFSLTEVFDWLYEANPSSKWHLISALLFPRFLDIYNFPMEIKQLAIAELDRLEKKHYDFLDQPVKDFIVHTRNRLNETMDLYDSTVIDAFKEFTKKYDEGMGENTFANLWPEVNEVLKKY